MVLSKINNYGKLVMFSHTIFSLPFGIIAMLWAANGVPHASTFFYIFLALVAARNGANAFNRIADRAIDIKNERTSKRVLVTGQVKLWEAYAITAVCFLVLAFSAYMLNTLCLILLPFALGIFLLYSYTKRFTWLCHYVLGVACGGAPVGAWIAVTGKIELVPLVLGAAVCMWIAGFDIIYATQDIEFDRKERLHSVPAKFGLATALWISRVSHIISICLLTSCYFLMDRGIFYLVGCFASAVLLAIEHFNVAPQNRNKMIFASYSINQILSLVFFAFAMLDFLVK